MPDEKGKIPIQSALIPVFYQNFHCLAQDCKDSCCVNWNITFDKKDYLRLRRLDAPAGLKARLEDGVRRERKGNHDGVFYGKFDLDSNSGRCPFLDPDGLCAIQRACGHDALPFVCKNYPRHTGYTFAAKEYSLSPSCEGVLQQLWDLPEGIEFIENPLPDTEQRWANVKPGETLEGCFAPIRELCVDILQNRDIPLSQRMLCLGLVLQQLQKEDWAVFEPDGWVERISAMIGTDEFIALNGKIAGNRDMFLTQNIKVLYAIASSEKGWPEEIFRALGVKQEVKVNVQEGSGKLSVEYSRPVYEQALERFQAVFTGHEYFFENLMVASALYLNFPQLSSKETLWKSYVSLCSLYSFYRFVSVLGCAEGPTKQRLFHIIVMASRSILHNRYRFNGFQEDLFQNESSTLAHMAILLLWN